MSTAEKPAHPKTVRLRHTEDGHATKHGMDYLSVAMGDPAELVYNAMKVLKNAPAFDTMVGRGLSGALVVPMLARAMNKWFAIVRKGEQCHTSEMVEGRLGDKWLFVDDLMASGDTARAAKTEIEIVKPGMEWVGIYLYGGSAYDVPRFRSPL